MIADEVCAWLILLAGCTHIVLTELFHSGGSVLDTGLLYVFVAMFNILRIRNSETVKRLKLFCLGANISTLTLEIVRWNMFGRSSSPGLETGASGLALLLFVQTAFSVVDIARHRTAPEQADKNKGVNRSVDRATTGCLSIVISVVAGFFLLTPLMGIFDAMHWPVFHSWGMWHGSIIIAWPALTLLSFCVLRVIRWRVKRNSSNELAQ